MSIPLETAPAKVLDAILHGPSKTSNPGVILLDYRHKDTFSALWLHGLSSGIVEIDGHSISLTSPSTQILLIGNDPPDCVFDSKLPSLKGINFRSHFTATSWLAAWKVKFSPTDEQKKSGAVESLARIAVIDPRPFGTATGVAQALQTIFAARDVTASPLVPGATVLNAPSLEAICQWLKPAKSDTRTLAKDALHLRDLLKSTIWNEVTSNREQHHALSNVVGALLLRAEVGGENPDAIAKQTQEYLGCLLHTCGVVSKPKGSGTKGWTDKNYRKDIEGVVLIDDMADIWQGFLSVAWAGAPNRVHTAAAGKFVATMEGPGPLPADDSLTGFPKRLQDFLESDRIRLSSEDLIPSDQPTPGRESFVLFLDLRLGLSDRFHQQLRKVGSSLLFSRRNLPWLTVDTRAKFAADLETGETDETLLPRLIALLDPTLPIIIFSSTHRTELIDPFRDYGNIITTFRKPILTGLIGDWTLIVEEIQRDFRSAVEQATRINTVRRRIQLVEIQSRFAPCLMKLEENKSFHVEIYLDEGTGAMAPVGGLFAVFKGDNPERAKQNAQCFDDLLVEKGVRYFKSHNIGPQSQTIKEKGDECLGEVQHLCQWKDLAYFGALRVRLKNTPISGLPSSSSFELVDQAWIGGLEAVLELFLGEWLGSAMVGHRGDISLGIYVATRSIPSTDQGDSERARFRCGWQTTSNLIQTFDRRDCWRIARAILEQRKISIRLDRALGSSLVYERTPTGRSSKAKEWFVPEKGISIGMDDNPVTLRNKLSKVHSDMSAWRPDYRSLLYAADACLKKWGNWSEALGPNVMDLHLEASLAEIACAGRFLDDGRISESLLRFPKAVSKDNQPIACILATRLLHGLATISGPEFLRAFQGVCILPADGKDASSQLTEAAGVQLEPPDESPSQSEISSDRFGLRFRDLPNSVTSQECLDDMLRKKGISGFSSHFSYTGLRRRAAFAFFSSAEQRDFAYGKTLLQFRSERFELGEDHEAVGLSGGSAMGCETDEV